MDAVIAYRGCCLTIEWAMWNDGSLPGLDFYNGLDKRWQARLLALFIRLGESGHIKNTEQFSRYVGDFYGFKIFQAEMPCYFRPNKRVVITHGFIKKKKGVTPASEGKRAETIRQAYEEILAARETCRMLRMKGAGGKDD